MMRVWNVKRQWKRIFFVHCRKHRCPVCGGDLETEKVSKIVNSGSEEAKNFDFDGFDSHMIGNVKFIWTQFRCGCGGSFSIDEIYSLERKKRS